MVIAVGNETATDRVFITQDTSWIAYVALSIALLLCAACGCFLFLLLLRCWSDHRLRTDILPDDLESELDYRDDPEDVLNLTEHARANYERARAWQDAYPPESIPTDITPSQQICIQEKGVTAWEFTPDISTNVYVVSRTEISFYDGECCVQTNLPVPKMQEVYYWEAKMMELPLESTVAVGFATKPYPPWRLPGWNRHSIAYFSDTGEKHINSPFRGRVCGPPFYQGDVVGVGYRPRTGTIFFTRNGKKLEDGITGVRYNLFPTIGSDGPCVVHVNFGQAGFVYIEANIKKWGLAPQEGTLAPPPAYGVDIDSILLDSGDRPNEPQADTSTTPTAVAARNSFSQGVLSMLPSDAQIDISLAEFLPPPPSYSSTIDHNLSESKPQDNQPMPGSSSRVLEQLIDNTQNNEANPEEEDAAYERRISVHP
ncbi:uncharacterized protein VTP21DRAFT_524 [Calcarisporiella thermophila]|uniref:uncharacterized protein n=1 Tax=Calcarisporiella thermophila TaxID=911321 RepID=UPI003742121A